MYNYQPKDVIIEGKWLVLSKIGQGSFGEVFKVQDIHTNRFYAIKRESSETHYPQLYHESTIYNILKNGPCIPKYHWYGQYDGYECIVLELLGSSLKKFQQIVKDIPLDIVIELGCQLISCLEYIHSKGLVYRDIKPENFLFSKSCVLETHATNSLDFGLTTWWQNPKTKKPFPDSKKPIKFKTGTARYASLNVHHGHTHTRRDDMESLGYVLLDLLLGGNLPWSGVTARTSKAGWDRLMSIKEDISLEDLCHGLPHGIMNFIDYTRRLQFSEQPDYIHLQELLRACTQPGPFSKSV
ncbi:kinase-like domain-containing protein, partial [Cokeromyces recurvatus]|uniref:kinase-like domain-containing protein n=1 Tax=Cokeromyces recurvatus TaxID=90255 RepID=UPI00221F18EB